MDHLEKRRNSQRKKILFISLREQKWTKDAKMLKGKKIAITRAPRIRYQNASGLPRGLQGNYKNPAGNEGTLPYLRHGRRPQVLSIKEYLTVEKVRDGFNENNIRNLIKG